MPFSGLWTLQPIHSSPITINHTQVPSTQTDFPVLVPFTDNRFKTLSNGGHVANSSAFDLGFYADSGMVTKLNWEIERYNGATGEVVAWVKIPSVSSASDTTFYAFYGDTTIHTDQSTPVSVWSNGFSSVYHLKDGTTLSVSDSLNTNPGTNHGVTAATGQIDGGGGFASASSQYVDLGAFLALTAMTISAWVNGTTFPNDYNGVITNGAASSDQYGIFVKSSGKLFMISAAGARSYDGTGSHTLSTATWYYLVLTYSNTAGLVGYVNASSDGTAASGGGGGSNPGVITAIGRQQSTATRYFNGVIDEGRVASVVRSADWVTCEYNNQQTGQTFVTLGTEV